MAIKIPTKKVDEATQLHTAADGVEQHFGNMKNINILNVGYTPAALAAKLNGYGDQVGQLVNGEQQLKLQRVALEQEMKTIRGTLAAVHGLATSTFGPSATELTDFGFTPTKMRVPRDTVQRVASMAKAKSTRTTLGTKGKNQKKAALAAAAAAAAAGGSTASQPASTSTTPVATSPSLTVLSSPTAPPVTAATAPIAPAAAASHTAA